MSLRSDRRVTQAPRLLAALVGLGVVPAAAQGVPAHDLTAFGRLAAILDHQAADAELQAGKGVTRAELARLATDQLEALDRITAAMTGPGFNPASLETDPAIGASAVYGSPGTPGPMDSRLFGEARETVEMMIVRVAGEYAGTAGVHRVGLTPTQWRCLFQALVKQESAFSVTAESGAGAYGLTQLMPGTAADLGVDRYDPVDNLRGGARYITDQMARFGTVPHALAAYNAGPGRVLQYDGIPPFAETQTYVRRITGYYNTYLASIGGPDALGTLDTSDMALAEYSNTADASMQYAAASHASALASLERLRRILVEIDRAPDAKTAMDLNSYARIELARIVTARMRLAAARGVYAAAHGVQAAADIRAEQETLTMTVTR